MHPESEWHNPRTALTSRAENFLYLSDFGYLSHFSTYDTVD